MRIAFVIEKLADRSGGAERVLIETANALCNRGHVVDIVTHEPRGKPPFYKTTFGVRVVNTYHALSRHGVISKCKDVAAISTLSVLPFYWPFGKVKWLLQRRYFLAALRKWLRQEEPDIIVAFLPPAITISRMATDRVPIIASLHNVPAQDYDSPDRWDPNPYDRRLRKSALLNCEAITILLEEFKEWFPAATHKKISIVPNAVKPVGCQLPAMRERRKVVLSVGRLARVKRHDVLVRAWKLICDEFPEWSVEIFGVGPEEAFLKSLIGNLGLEGRVFLRGHTQALQARYLESSILAHPASFEGFGLAVAEALASGMPAVAFSDCSGANTLITDGKNGRLVDGNGDPVSNFADALRELLADEETRQQMGERAIASIEPYNPDKIIDIWEDLVVQYAKKSYGSKMRNGS